MNAFRLLLLAYLLHHANAEIGWDLSYFQGDVPVSSFNCLISNDYGFGCIEATAGTGGYNPYVRSVMQNAHNAGFVNVDVYIFPNTQESPASSMKTIIDNLLQCGALSKNMVWMDIEDTSAWSSSCSDNQNWLQQAINQINSMYKGCGLSSCVGIYTSETMNFQNTLCGTPITITTPGRKIVQEHSKWFHKGQIFKNNLGFYMQSNLSFSDFVPFGGWTKPSIKQYEGTTNICSTSIDKDYY